MRKFRLLGKFAIMKILFLVISIRTKLVDRVVVLLVSMIMKEALLIQDLTAEVRSQNRSLETPQILKDKT